MTVRQGTAVFSDSDSDSQSCSSCVTKYVPGAERELMYLTSATAYYVPILRFTVLVFLAGMKTPRGSLFFSLHLYLTVLHYLPL